MKKSQKSHLPHTKTVKLCFDKVVDPKITEWRVGYLHLPSLRPLLFYVNNCYCYSYIYSLQYVCASKIIKRNFMVWHEEKCNIKENDQWTTITFVHVLNKLFLVLYILEEEYLKLLYFQLLLSFFNEIP